MALRERLKKCFLCPMLIRDALPGERIHCVFRPHRDSGDEAEYYTQHEVCAACFDREQQTGGHARLP